MKLRQKEKDRIRHKVSQSRFDQKALDVRTYMVA